MKELEQLVIETYKEFDVPADRIIADPAVGSSFANLLKSKRPDAEELETSELNKLILRLRKRGEDNGGLPRLRNAYNGRKPK